MAKYFLLVKIFSRGRGSRVTRAAAYRAGERIHDDRTSESYNYSKRKDIVHSEIILPSGLANHPDMEWARDRAKLWNEAEKAGTRRNSRLGREVLVILPPEIGAALSCASLSGAALGSGVPSSDKPCARRFCALMFSNSAPSPLARSCRLLYCAAFCSGVCAL